MKIQERGYTVIKQWMGYDVYEIPTLDLLGVWSPIHCRRMGSYKHIVQDMLNDEYLQIPLLCFVAGDGMLRVKWGCVAWLAAKETKKVESLHCVFPGNPKKTDALRDDQRAYFNFRSGAFC